ncbi:Uncharacterised protein [Citrobacter koseri]|uniref:Uncharacterized protein n=1 Tax=Citrobacter koseri TaxID=545 RepID=A0A2X2YFK4_CITKO|nr:Uncharacterised protein [Citrobacter koseri]
MLSLSGFAGFSAAINFFTSARIAGGRGFASAFGIHMAGKEILQFKNAAWTVQILLRGHTGNRRFVHLDGLGDVRQHHRFHKLFALLEEGLLLLNNTAAHA